MELVVAGCITLCILMFIFRECAVLYIARTKRSGLLLESITSTFYRDHNHLFIRKLDRWLTLAIIATVLLYVLYIYLKLSQAAEPYELQFIDAGIAILLYIVFPSRTISHFITEKGVQGQHKITDWTSIYTVCIESESTVRRMLLVQFKGNEKMIEGYMHDRDLGSLKQLLAPHSILVKEN